jgi:hypothetical protein
MLKKKTKFRGSHGLVWGLILKLQWLRQCKYWCKERKVGQLNWMEDPYIFGQLIIFKGAKAIQGQYVQQIVQQVDILWKKWKRTLIHIFHYYKN